MRLVNEFVRSWCSPFAVLTQNLQKPAEKGVSCQYSQTRHRVRLSVLPAPVVSTLQVWSRRRMYMGKCPPRRSRHETRSVVSPRGSTTTLMTARRRSNCIQRANASGVIIWPVTLSGSFFRQSLWCSSRAGIIVVLSSTPCSLSDGDEKKKRVREDKPTTAFDTCRHTRERKVSSITIQQTIGEPALPT